MTKRKGLGKGRGKGYKNLIPKDKKVHADSAKGKKQPQKINYIPYANKGKSSDSGNSELRQEIEDALGEDFIREFADDVSDSQIESVEEYYGNDGTYLIKLEDGKEYRIFKDEDQAERMAEDIVRDDLENEPELFSQDFLEQHYSMSDTDRRIIAGEEADARLDGMDDGDLITDYGYEDEFDEIQEKIDALEDEITEGVSEEKEKKLQDKIDQYEQDKDQLIDEARDDARYQIYDEVYDALDDPYDYFVEEQGMYSREEFFKASFMSLDVEDAVEDAISQDGWAHFISRYDGDYTELGSGQIVVREN